MSLLDLIIPQLISYGQTCEEGLNNLMAQDWNHWKLQVLSWMEDAKEAEAQSSANAKPNSGCDPRRDCGPNSCGQSSRCGSQRNQGFGFGDTSANPLQALHQMWTQFASAGQQNKESRKEATNNQVNNTSDKYVIKLDVQHFEANEISVKLENNQIVVDGQHPERTDRLGRVSRKFQRKYDLPPEVEPNTIVSTLTASGVLIIEGLKKKVPEDNGSEIKIPVIREQTNLSDEDQDKYQNEQQMD